MLNYLKGPWAIAVHTWREGYRKKTLIGFLILSILVIFGASFMTAFMQEISIGEGEDTDVNLKLIKDICITAISIFGILITIFISASVVPNEVENKVIYTVLSKPVRRFQYLLGKFVGVQLTILMNLAMMTALFFVILYLNEHIMPTLLIWAVFLIYFQFLIVSSFTFAISCAATSAVLPTIAGLFIYIAGNLTEYLKDVANRAGQTEHWLDSFIGGTAKVLTAVLPNLQDFSVKQQFLMAQPNDPLRDVMVPQLILTGLLFASAGYIMAYWIFRRKEM
jgi:ABC-type transport system involved in multi-copper enzyme maturation permease subunit